MNNFFVIGVSQIKTGDLKSLADWLYWNLNVIKINKIILYDNNSPVDVATLCKKYGNRVEYHRSDGWMDEKKLMTTHKDDAVYVISLDEIEYLYVDEKYEFNINEFLFDTKDISLLVRVLKSDKRIVSLFDLFKRREAFVNEYYKKYFKKDLNCCNPLSISEKINWLKIFDSTHKKADYTDKLLAKKLIKSKIKDIVVLDALDSADSPEKLNFDRLPTSFVLKCNHGSGMNIVIKDKRTIDRQQINYAIKNWLNQDFGMRFGEYHYCFINRKCFAEKYMNFNTLETDYKFWCFSGEPKFYTVNADPFKQESNYNINHYDLNGNLLDISRINHSRNENIKFSPPKNIDKMIRYCRILAKDFPIVRVDFYEKGDDVIFGEMTFTPGAGKLRYENPNTDMLLGSYLDILNIQKYFS